MMLDLNALWAVFGVAGLTMLVFEIQDRKNQIIEKFTKWVNED